MFHQYSLDSDDNHNTDFDDLLKKAMGLLKAKKRFASIVEILKKSQEVEDLMEKYNHNARISSISNSFITPLFISP